MITKPHHNHGTLPTLFTTQDVVNELYPAIQWTSLQEGRCRSYFHEHEDPAAPHCECHVINFHGDLLVKCIDTRCKDMPPLSAWSPQTTLDKVRDHWNAERKAAH